MTDEERIDDAYERIDRDTDEFLAFYDGESVERRMKSIWDSTVTMHQIATVALKENAKLRRLAKAAWGCAKRHVSCDECRVVCGGCTLQSAMRELGIEDDE